MNPYPRTTYPNFAEALNAEMQQLYNDLLRDSLRPSLFWAGPTLGPKAPADLVRKYRLTAEGYVAPPSLATRLRRRCAAVSERASLTWGVLRHGDTHECDAW